MEEQLKKVSEKLKRFFSTLIKNPLFRKVVIIATIIVIVILFLVIACYLTFAIDTSGTDDAASFMSTTVADTLADIGIGRRRGALSNSSDNREEIIISEDKIFYIGDSWMVGLSNSGKAKSSNTYFYSKGGENADWVLSNYSDMQSKIPAEISCIVVEFGLNGLTNWDKTQELVDKLAQDYSGKNIYVLQTPHICEGYTVDSNFNSKVDTYNENMKNYCSNKSSVTFINPTTTIVSNNGTGFLKDEYAQNPNDTSMGGGKIHLNNSGYEEWYKSIIESISKTTSNGSNNGNNRTMTGNGQGEVISESDYETTGYSGIYKSGITGREFVEYKQNAYTYLEQYPIDGVGCSWGSECGTVTTIIIGSGYSDRATFEDAWNNLKDNGGQTDINGWIQNYASSAQVENTSINKDNIISLLSQGAVLAVHSSTLTDNGHYFALLDINSDHTQVYVSNPWGGSYGDPAGWSDIDRVQGLLDTAVAISNDGDLPTHNGNNNTNRGGATYTTTNVVNHITENGRGGYKIDIDLDEKVEEIIKKLEENEEGRLLQYFSEKNRKKCLKSFLKAAIVTQYPDLRKKSEIGTEVPENELQGVVKVRRRTENTGEDDLGELLEYIPLDKFNNMKNNGDNNIFNYYTLDSNSNIVVAGYEKRSVEPQNVDYGGDTRRDTIESPSLNPLDRITFSKMNYIQQVEKYAMPFDLLWTLLVYSQDEDFVYKLSELAIKNDIVITVHDSITYKDTIDEYTYTKNVEINQKSTFSDTTQSPPKVGNKTYEGNIEMQFEYKITNRNYYVSNNPILAVTYVNSWVARYENKYKKVHQGPNTNKNETNLGDDDNYDEETVTIGDIGNTLVNSWKSDYKSLLSSAYSGTDKKGKEEYSISTILNYKSKKTNKNRTETITTEKNTYQSQPAEVQGKYDPKADEDNFVTLLRKSKKSDNLKSVAEWFFESIEKQESICDMLDLMKFLLGKAYNKDYGVKDFDFSIYKPEYFTSIGGGMAGGTVEEKVWYALRTAGYSEYSTAGVMGNIYGECGFDSNLIEGGNGIGFGLCQWSFERRTSLENYAASKGVEPSDVNTQIEFLLTEISSTGGPADGYATFMGTAGIYGCDMDGWVNADSVEEATKQFCGWFERPASKHFYGDSMNNTRIPKAIEYYNQFHGRDLSTFLTGGSGGSIIECAERIHTYMEDNGYFYSCDGSLLKSTFEESKSTRAVCCASYVCWVVIEAGYLDPGQMSHGAFSAADAIEAAGFVQVSESEMQAGDILSYGQRENLNGHIEIYAGNDQIYNAGGNDSIQCDNPYTRSSGHRTDYYKILRAPR